MILFAAQRGGEIMPNSNLDNILNDSDLIICQVGELIGYAKSSFPKYHDFNNIGIYYKSKINEISRELADYNLDSNNSLVFNSALFHLKDIINRAVDSLKKFISKNSNDGFQFRVYSNIDKTDMDEYYRLCHELSSFSLKDSTYRLFGDEVRRKSRVCEISEMAILIQMFNDEITMMGLRKAELDNSDEPKMPIKSL